MIALVPLTAMMLFANSAIAQGPLGSDNGFANGQPLTPIDAMPGHGRPEEDKAFFIVHQSTKRKMADHAPGGHDIIFYGGDYCADQLWYFKRVVKNYQEYWRIQNWLYKANKLASHGCSAKGGSALFPWYGGYSDDNLWKFEPAADGKGWYIQNYYRGGRVVLASWGQGLYCGNKYSDQIFELHVARTCQNTGSNICQRSGDFGATYRSSNEVCMTSDVCQKECCLCNGSDDWPNKSQCSWWAVYGYCEHSYVSWMKTYCKQSCCTALYGHH